MEVPRLQEVLEQVSVETTSPATGRKFPTGQIYITLPGPLGFEDPFYVRDYYQVGAKVTYFDKTGHQEQFGQIMRTTGLDKAFLERYIPILGAELAEGILRHEEGKKPLPTRPLTPETRARLELPF